MTSEQLAALTARWEQVHGAIETIPLHRRDVETEGVREPKPVTTERIRVRDFLMTAAQGLTVKDAVKATGVSSTVIREEAKSVEYQLHRPPRGSQMREHVVQSFHKGVPHPTAAEMAGCTIEYARRIYRELKSQ